jgi:hypothetical protein
MFYLKHGIFSVDIATVAKFLNVGAPLGAIDRG